MIIKESSKIIKVGNDNLELIKYHPSGQWELRICQISVADKVTFIFIIIQGGIHLPRPKLGPERARWANKRVTPMGGNCHCKAHESQSGITPGQEGSLRLPEATIGDDSASKPQSATVTYILYYKYILPHKDTRNCQEKMKKISYLKPDQLAPSIYIMKELCFFSLDQWEISIQEMFQYSSSLWP